VPGGDADAMPHPRVRDGAQEAVKVEIGCWILFFERRTEAIPVSTPQSKVSGQVSWATLKICSRTGSHPSTVE
jgi:hypothetical protein